MLRPPKLQPGDAIGVVAPAGPVEKEPLEKGMKVLRRMGFEPVPGRHLAARQRYLAGKDEDRAQDLIDMFADPQIKAIVCARGGYGVNRILGRIQPKLVRENPKIVVGASDITLLLLYLNQKCNLVTFHGPMVAGNFGCFPMRRSRKQFQSLLAGNPDGRKLFAPKARVLIPGSAKGPLTGGCLTLLCRSLRTAYEVQTRGKILLIEDVNEPAYRIDGMLWQLQQAGKFQGVKAIVLGEMVHCDPRSKKHGTLEDIYRDALEDLRIPIVTHFPIGHGREMWTLPIGVEALLDAEAKTLELVDNGVV